MISTQKEVQVIRLEELKAKLGGVSKATIYRWMDEGVLPRSFKIGGRRASGWLVSDIDQAILAMHDAA